MQYMSSGRLRMPVLLRGCVGIGHSAATHHSGSYYAMFAHVPGLRVVVPSRPYDAKGLLAHALRSSDPVLFLEHREVLGVKGPVPADDYGDRYHFGAAVTGAVTCRWIQQYATAVDASDDAAATEASDALGTSRDWDVLREMDAEGDYPEVVWEISRDVVRGDVPAEYAQGLGCD